MNNTVNNGNYNSIARSAFQDATLVHEILSAIDKCDNDHQIEICVGKFTIFARQKCKDQQFKIDSLILLNKCNMEVQVELSLPTNQSDMSAKCEASVRGITQMLPYLISHHFIERKEIDSLYHNIFSLASRTSGNCTIIVSSHFQRTILQLYPSNFVEIAVNFLRVPVTANSNNAITAMRLLVDILASHTKLGTDALESISNIIIMAVQHNVHRAFPAGISVIQCVTSLIERYMGIISTDNKIWKTCDGLFDSVVEAHGVFDTVFTYFNAIAQAARACPQLVAPYTKSIIPVLTVNGLESEVLKKAKQECSEAILQIQHTLPIANINIRSDTGLSKPGVTVAQTNNAVDANFLIGLKSQVATDLYEVDAFVHTKDMDIDDSANIAPISDNLPACPAPSLPPQPANEHLFVQAPAVITATSAQPILPLSYQISLRIAEAYQEALLPESEDEVYPAQGIMAAIMSSCNPAADATTKNASVSFLVGYRGSICLMPREVAADASQFIEYFEANAANVPQVYKDYLVTKFGGMWYDAVKRIVVPDDGLGVDSSDSDDDDDDDDDSAMEIDESNNYAANDDEAASRIAGMAIVAATFGRLLNMLSPRLMHSFISYLHKLGELEHSDIASSILREMNAGTPTELAEVADQLHSELVQYHQNREPSSDVESQKGQYIGHVVLQHKDHLLSFAHDKRLPAEERISILTSVAGLLDLPASCDARVSQYLQDQFFVRADIIDLLGKDDVTVEDIESCMLTFHELGKFCSKALYTDTGILDRMDNIVTTHHELFAENEIWLDMLGSVSSPHQNISQMCQQEVPRVNCCVHDNPTARSAA